MNNNYEGNKELFTFEYKQPFPTRMKNETVLLVFSESVSGEQLVSVFGRNRPQVPFVKMETGDFVNVDVS